MLVRSLRLVLTLETAEAQGRGSELLEVGAACLTIGDLRLLCLLAGQLIFLFL